ncbi:Enhancer of split mgamma protein [Eumeta japonica]|uniref:Enhancer of split mgamma protein n=1 Tax=Eumeta variegata TaxID=151549 RepID=A0A4C1UWZ9_EUMVA|nr:Enhancer of split mgamma protein [Eumeta japonica]
MRPFEVGPHVRGLAITYEWVRWRIAGRAGREGKRLFQAVPRRARAGARVPKFYELFSLKCSVYACVKITIMSYDPAPLSKTAKYKKITKPLLERKRRARINRCLDELKDLMVGALEVRYRPPKPMFAINVIVFFSEFILMSILRQSAAPSVSAKYNHCCSQIDDDNLSKLEKADILELTVNHITKLHSPKDPVLEAKKFQAGFGQCAAEACRFIMSVPDLDAKVSRSLIDHLSRLVAAQPLTVQVPERPPFSPPCSPSSIASDRHHYCSDLDRSSSDAEDSYSADGRRSWNPGPARHPPEVPPAGLLTTVDKLPHNSYRYAEDERKSNHLPKGPEAKETILQKIRQHIMDKRVNEEKYQEVPTAVVYAQSDTLDLRKVRSPTKHQEGTAPNATTPRNDDVERDLPAATAAPAAASVPEQCQLPMDYNSLPPKKKRKLLEYQEHKKLEEARRRDAFYEHKKQHLDGPPANTDDGSAWRPW